MNRFYFLNSKVLLRGGIIVVACALFGYIVLGTALGNYINRIYIQTNDGFFRSLFYFLSNNRVIIVSLCCIAVFISASGWIFKPLFDNYSELVRNNININRDTDYTNVKLSGHLKALEDVLNNVNTELRLSRYAAREAEQRKDDLVVYLAHDIRTPLTSVLGYLELLIENKDLSEAQRRKFMDSALRKASRMQTLVEELFEVTRYSITQIELEKSHVDLGMMLNQLVEELRPVLEQRDIETEIILEDTTDVFIDPDKLARSIDNVLHNAAYYTPPGGKITITTDSIDTSARVRISNTGMEIPPEKLSRLFEKFYRGDQARQSESGGSGLGLAIAKNIIEAHGGSITAENSDKVTTFTILL